MKKSLYFVVTLAMFLALVFPAPAAAAPQSYVIPTFSITGVVRDSTVSIYTYNFPANDSFDVLMNVMGTRGVGGYKVATVNSGAGGSFAQTFNIPPQLYGLRQISIRLQSNTGSAYYAFNWFYNNTATIGTAIGGPNVNVKPAAPAPTFSVTVVDFDNSVTVRTAHLPAGDNVRFRMDEFGNQGVGGDIAATFATGTGGVQEFNMPIPAGLAGTDYIHIRMESINANYYAYAWFANDAALTTPPPTGGTTGGTGGGTGGGYVNYPIFYITGVVRDQTVTIQTYNLPKNDNFNVRMGLMGTRGVGGYLVTSVPTGAGGVQTFTFNIPAELRGQNQIAIRMESPTSNFYAYNWFFNNTTNW